MRIGVGHPGERHQVTKYLVTARFDDADEQWLVPLIDAILDSLPLLAEDGGDAKFTNKVALLTKPKREKKEPPAGGGEDD